ncbi:MAG TPA: prepilin-type N-terminal cleavage/methylation domain-containing protein [Candidatus Woesebacteria bacterium]|nr:prepilin-type N-terminal cleavage/methylation domain-containing protein [Candidatus Woesebacteria bacterium]
MKNKSGFTLIELLVAIAIGILVIGFGSVALNDFNEKQKVESTRQELLSNLRLARNYAVTNQLEGDEKLVVNLDEDGNLTIKNESGKKIFFNKDISPKGVKITATNIYFSVNNGRSVSATSLDGIIVDISIATDDDSTTKNIRIEESGLIL